jgi:diguanylate cyclase (GGDEF)-like protein
MLEDLSDSHTRLQHEAFHDHLTGLGNRRLLLKELDDAFRAVKSRHIEGFTLLLMDLDDFKDINDLYGHLAGDQVIKVIAERLGGCTRSPDIAVRLGGDEFAVLIRNSRTQSCERHAEILLDALTRPIIWDGITLGVKASIGIVTADASADPGSNPIDWLRKADIAMYASKNRTKNGYLVFHADLESSLSERKRMESELSIMIGAESSEIWMQPILKQSDGSLFALEALSRWFHPVLGEISPLTFIRMAEDTKLIDRFDRSVIRRCCALIAGLRLRHPELYLCINVSALTLMEPDFSAFIARQIRLHSIPDGALMLEITETVLASDEAALLNGIRAIRQLGVRFLIDDFGTGYSSLSRLNALPLDFLKIDGSFLTALDNGQDTICKTIIRMAHSLGMQVIAEGVETEAQRRRLAELACDYLQGYHFAKPMDSRQLEHYLRSL